MPYYQHVNAFKPFLDSRFIVSVFTEVFNHKVFTIIYVMTGAQIRLVSLLRPCPLSLQVLFYFVTLNHSI